LSSDFQAPRLAQQATKVGFKFRESMQGARVVILTGDFQGQQGVCLGEPAGSELWAISPDDSNEILSLTFEKDFGLLMDLSGNPHLN
jgi:hypothetical protein